MTNQTDLQSGIRLPNGLLNGILLVVALLGITLAPSAASAYPNASRSLIRHDNQKVESREGWPAGVDSFLNSRFRTYGWTSRPAYRRDFLEYYELHPDTTDDANQLIREFALIESPDLRIVLRERQQLQHYSPGGGPIHSNPAMLLLVGDQKQLNEHYRELTSRAGDADLVPPTALPPTLLILVASDAIDLEKLSIPATIEVTTRIFPVKPRIGKDGNLAVLSEGDKARHEASRKQYLSKHPEEKQRLDQIAAFVERHEQIRREAAAAREAEPSSGTPANEAEQTEPRDPETSP